MIPKSFPGRGEYNVLFNVDIVNLLLKNNGGETSFYYFCSLENSNCRGLVVVAWGRKSYLRQAEISSFTYLLQFKYRERRVSLRLHLFVSDVDLGNEGFVCKRVGTNILLRGPRNGKVLLRSFASC